MYNYFILSWVVGSCVLYFICSLVFASLNNAFIQIQTPVPNDVDYLSPIPADDMCPFDPALLTY